MQRDRIPSFALGLMIMGAALLFWIPVFVRPIAKAANDGNPEQWLGFAGNIIGAFAAITAACIALFAAYRTIKPVRDQLTELIKQNEHVTFDKLRERATDLNDELILLNRVAGDGKVMDLQVAEFATGSDPRNSFNRAEMALDRYAESVRLLQAVRGSVWGDKETQESRDRFIDAALRCGSAGSVFLTKTRSLHQAVFITAKPALAAWGERFRELEQSAQPVYERITAETKKVRISIGALERRLFE